MNMIPLLFFLALAAIYVGTIETAFSALMRLSLRLMVERGGRDDRLGYYLDDPIQLFVPARLMLGLIFSCIGLRFCCSSNTGRKSESSGFFSALVTSKESICILEGKLHNVDLSCPKIQPWRGGVLNSLQ